MATIDPEEERQRLRDFYSRQMDGRLEQVATEADGMTDVARELLKGELLRRGLDVDLLQPARAGNIAPAPAEVPPEPQPIVDEDALPGEFEKRNMLTIRRFRDLPEALLAKGSLDSAGIDSFLEDENMVRMDWFISNLLGGIKLVVDAENVEAANEILNQPIPENFDVEGVGDYQQPRCPQCQSMDVSFEELDKPIAYGGLFVNIPIPVHRKGWLCHSCKNAWQEDEAGPNAKSM
jgi:hypothetical protein